MTAWLIRRARRPAAALRLYCFPHAGGSAGEYAFWGDELAAAEVSAIQLPGRGGRFAEPSLTSIAAVRDAVLAGVGFAPPFALFGHSLGAVVAFEVARGLEARGAGPACLVVSAARAPHLAACHAPISQLDDRALIAELADRDLASVLDDPELRELALPALRADLAIADGYQLADGPPLACPIVALGGMLDDVTADELAGWRRHTTGGFTCQLFEGGHFYTRTARAAVIARLAALARELAP